MKHYCDISYFVNINSNSCDKMIIKWTETEIICLMYWMWLIYHYITLQTRRKKSSMKIDIKYTVILSKPFNISCITIWDLHLKFFYWTTSSPQRWSTTIFCTAMASFLLFSDQIPFPPHPVLHLFVRTSPLNIRKCLKKTLTIFKQSKKYWIKYVNISKINAKSKIKWQCQTMSNLLVALHVLRNFIKCLIA